MLHNMVVAMRRRALVPLVAGLFTVIVIFGACDSSPASLASDAGVDAAVDGPAKGDGRVDSIAPADGFKVEASPGDGPSAMDGPRADGSTPDSAVPDGLPPKEDASPSPDTGTPTPDTGTPTPDTGTPTPDTGTPTPDTGTPTPDTGTPTPDTGTPTPDTGTPTPDTGTQVLCGNGVRNAGEECDDGNQINLDGCSASCRFEQVLRVDYLQLQYGTTAACSKNAFGGAIVLPLAQGQLQGAIDGGIADGSISILFGFVGLDDLSGAADPAVQVGLMGGTPVAGAGYSGINDLDWWYTVDAQTINANRQPLALLSGRIANNVLDLGPGNMSLSLSLGGSPATLSMSNVRVVATNAGVSTPTASAGSTPGHPAAEHLDPALTSFSRSGQPSASGAGRLCGDISAESLAAVPVPAALTGFFGCSQGYSVGANSMLDVLIGGCNIIFVGQAIAPTQPDSADASVPLVGAGPPYTLAANNQRVVNGCRDKNNQVVSLPACLRAAAYSSFFRLAAGRVIGK